MKKTEDEATVNFIIYKNVTRTVRNHRKQGETSQKGKWDRWDIPKRKVGQVGHPKKESGTGGTSEKGKWDILKERWDI